MNDLTIIYYTANQISDHFMANTQKQLLKAAGEIPIISVSQKPIKFGQNVCVGDIGRSVYNIYKQILIGAKEAKTEYVATAEDDVLYPDEHFEYRPAKDVFAYDVNKWSIFSWIKPPIFSYRSRRTMTSLIVSREALIKTLEERFAKYPDPADIPLKYWGEPGRFEGYLGLRQVKDDRYTCPVPSIVFSTPEALGYLNQGARKKHSQTHADRVEPWGSAEEIVKLYGPKEEKI